MAGQKIVLPLSFTDTTLPYLKDDPVYPNPGVNGVLLHVEPAFSTDPLVGVPADGAVVPNLAWKTASAMIGNPALTKAQLSPVFNRSAAFTGNKGLIERSGKGGLHGIPSQVNGAANEGAKLSMPAGVGNPLVAYFVANPNHLMYSSWWKRVTRVSKGSITDIYSRWVGGGTRHNPFWGSGNHVDQIYPQTNPPWTGLGRTSQGSGAVAGVASILNETTNGWPSATTDINHRLDVLLFGTGLTTENSGGINAASSWIFYRFYMEDLTVSGRTYAEVDALDNASFTTQCMTAGGRYYNDTYTNPSTLP